MTMEATRAPREHLAAACEHARVDLNWVRRTRAVEARCAACGVRVTVPGEALSGAAEVDLDALLAEAFGPVWAARRKAAG